MKIRLELETPIEEETYTVYNVFDENDNHVADIEECKNGWFVCNDSIASRMLPNFEEDYLDGSFSTPEVALAEFIKQIQVFIKDIEKELKELKDLNYEV